MKIIPQPFTNRRPRNANPERLTEPKNALANFHIRCPFHTKEGFEN